MTSTRRLLVCSTFLLLAPACGGHGGGDKAPTPVIVDPHDGESFLPTNNITFDGTATDPEDGVLPASALRWELRNASNSIVLAFPGNGQQTVATAGDYTLYLYAKDSKGKEAHVTQPMHVGNTTARLTNPDNQSILGVGAPFNLDGTGTTIAAGATITSLTFTGKNADTGAQVFQLPVLAANANCNGAGTSCSTRVTPTIPAGHVTVTLDVATSIATEKATDTLHLIGDDPPTVAITSPTGGSTVAPGTSIAFTGTATAATQGQQLTIAWTDSIDGALGGQLSFNHSFTSVGTRQVTLTATDPLGLSASASIDLTIAPNGTQLFTTVGGLPLAQVLALAREDHGASADSIWVGMSGKYSSVAADTAAKDATDYTATGTGVTSALVSSAGERLFGVTGVGADVLAGTSAPLTLSSYATNDKNVHAITQLPSGGDLVFGTDNGIEIVAASHGAQSTSITTGDLANRILGLAADAAGTVWAAVDGAGLVKVDSIATTPALTTFGPQQGLASDVGTAVALHGADVWVGTDNGLSRVDTSTTPATITSWSDPLPDPQVLSVAVDANGIVWVGTINGAARFDPAKKLWTTFGTTSLPGRSVRALLVDKAGAKWLGCTNFGGGGGNGGLVRYTGS